MQKLVTKLKNNLQEQLKLYQYLYKLSFEKRRIIIQGSVDVLMDVDKDIEAITCELLTLEQKRLNLLDGYVTKSGKLTHFTSMLSPEMAAPLEEIRLELVTVMQNIEKINKLNIYLIDNSIRWIEHSVATIANIVSPESAAYNAWGKALSKSVYDMDNSGVIEHKV